MEIHTTHSRVKTLTNTWWKLPLSLQVITVLKSQCWYKKNFFCPQQLCSCVSKVGISLSVAWGILSLFWRQCEALFLCGTWNKQELWGESAKTQRHAAAPWTALGWLSHANDICGTQDQICSVPYRGSSTAQTIRRCESQEKQKLLLSSEWPRYTAQYWMRNPKGIYLKGK